MTKTKRDRHARLRARLRRAIDGVEGVRIKRKIPGADVLEGFVLATGKKWTVLANLADDFTLDGYIAIRTSDVDRVQRNLKRDLPTRLLLGRGQWPPMTLDPIPPLGRTASLLQSLAAQAPMLTVHIEDHDPDVCFIGVPVDWTAKAMWMLEISPRATWDDTLSRWRYRDITRVDVGRRYEAALFEVAGPPARPDAN